MFAKPLTTQAVDRSRTALVPMRPVGFANDNRRDWQLAGASPRRRRDRLVRRWRLSAVTGKPECFWEIAGGETAAGEVAEPVPLIVAAPLRRAKRAVRQRRETA